jgi:hypothetical protein
MRAVIGILAFALTSCARNCARADQLDFIRHHDAGLAIVTYKDQQFLAAYQADTFDAIHDPELPFKTLSRLILAPYFPQMLELPYFDGNVTSSVATQTSGHCIVIEGEYKIEMISADVSVRNYWRSLAGTSGSATKRLIVKTVRDALLLTVTDAQ